MSLLKNIFYFFLSSLSLLCVALYILGATESGSRLFITMACKIIPGKLVIDDFKGALLSKIVIQHLKYQQADTQIKLSNVLLAWRPFDLLHKKITIHEIKINDAEINFSSSSSSTKTLSTHLKNWLPFIEKLNLKHASFKNIFIKKNQQPFTEISNAEFRRVGNQLFIDMSSTLANVVGKVTYSFYPLINWDATLNVSQLNLGAISSEWQSQLNFQFKSNGEFNSGLKEIHADLQNMNGTWREAPVTGEMRVQLKKNKLAIEKAELQIGDAKINMAGDVAEEWNMHWELAIPTLQTLIPDTHGSFDSSGVIYGPMQQPEISGKLASHDLVISSLVIKTLQANLHSTLQIADLTHFTMGEINAELKQGEINIPTYKTQLAAIHLNLNYSNNRLLKLTGDFLAGEGQGHIKGVANLNQNDRSYTLELSGDDLQLANSRQYQVRLTPDLKFLYGNGLTKIEGNIFVSSAKINPKDFSKAVTLPTEVEFIDENETETSMPTHLSLNVNLHLGDDITLSYHNVATQLAGNLTITQKPGSPAIAVGELHTLNGQYRAYGKSLKIEEGRLIYTETPLTNPNLNIEAVQSIKRVNFTQDQTLSDQLKVGVKVTGTLNKPQVTLFSEPSGLTQNDILSYLIFGHPQSQINKASSLALLNGLATSIAEQGNQSGVGLTEKIQKLLHLSALNVGTTEILQEDASTTNTTTINISKNLSKKLSLNFTVGIFYPVQIFKIKYQINKYLAIQSEASSLESGGDILYTYER